MIFLVFVIVGIILFALAAEFFSCFQGTMASNLPGWAKAVIVTGTLLIGVSFIVGMCLTLSK